MDEIPPEAQRLHQLGVTAYLKDVVTLVLENRPEAPIEFIAEYFRNAAKGGGGISRSYRYIRLTQRHREAFMDNLLSAYTALDSKLHNSAGLTGREYSKLLRLLCNDFPMEVVDSLLQVMGKGPSDPIEFQPFCAGINACLLYEEFFEQVEWLFKACDHSGNGLVSRRTFDQVVVEMKANQAKVSESDTGMQIPSSHSLDEALSLAVSAETARRGAGGNIKEELTFKDFVAALFRTTRVPESTKRSASDGSSESEPSP